MRSEIVADFGSSHGGSVILALDLVNSAKKLGFTAVQFQLSTASHEWCALIDEHCKAIGIEWSAEVGDEECAEIIAQFNPRWIRMPRGKGYYLDLLNYCIRNFEEVRVSTENLGWNAIRIIKKILHSPPRKITGAVIETHNRLPQKRVGVLIHSSWNGLITADGMNMRAIERMRVELANKRVAVGYSGNVDSIYSGAVAVTYGATVIERNYFAEEECYDEHGNLATDTESAEAFIQGVREAERMIGSSCPPIEIQ